MNVRARAWIGLAAGLAGCTSLLGIDKDYVESAGIGTTDGGVRDGGGIGADGDILLGNEGGPWGIPFAINAANDTSCALSSGGSVACWGDNTAGAVGDGTTVDRLRPVTTQALGGAAVAVAVGGTPTFGAHACALFASGDARCWGAGDAGQLGVADAATSALPVLVDALGALTSDAGRTGDGGAFVTAGGAFTCATAGGPVFCWGSNDSGQLGDGTQDTRSTPAPVSEISGVLALTAGEAHACALTAATGVRCWGANAYGQLGSSSFGREAQATPVKVDSSDGAIGVAAGGRHTCMIKASGRVLCFGANGSGQLGNGTTSSSPFNGKGIPEPVSWGAIAEPQAVTVAAGSAHTCVIAVGGAVYCWGANEAGQLGDGTTTTHPSPVAVRSVPANATGLALGREHSCAILADRSVKCWGGARHLGDGTPNSSVDAVNVLF